MRLLPLSKIKETLQEECSILNEELQRLEKQKLFLSERLEAIKSLSRLYGVKCEHDSSDSGVLNGDTSGAIGTLVPYIPNDPNHVNAKMRKHKTPRSYTAYKSDGNFPTAYSETKNSKEKVFYLLRERPRSYQELKKEVSTLESGLSVKNVRKLVSNGLYELKIREMISVNVKGKASNRIFTLINKENLFNFLSTVNTKQGLLEFTEELERDFQPEEVKPEAQDKKPRRKHGEGIMQTLECLKQLGGIATSKEITNLYITKYGNIQRKYPIGNIISADLGLLRKKNLVASEHEKGQKTIYSIA